MSSTEVLTSSTVSIGESKDAVSNWDEIEKITLSWRNINLFAKEGGRSCIPFKSKPARKTQILKNLNGQAFPGTMLAVMGSSGSGKSTFLNALTGRSLPEFSITGSILVNGKKDRKKLTKLSAYVEQNDLFIGTLTVREHLIFQAIMRMNESISYQEKLKRVEQVIIEMGLIGCSDNVIGVAGRIKGISGGERKRLSFASEILTNPSLMFCDEVTSGLDSFLSQSVVAVLKTMSDAGRTVVCAIHQPSSEVYAMFDRVLFMSCGRTAFIGTREEALSFFNRLGYQCPLNYNPADYIIHNLALIPGDEVSCKERIKYVCDEFEKTDTTQESKSEANSELSLYTKEDEKYQRYNASWCTQLRYVTWRSFINSRREPLLFKMRFFQTAVSLVMFSVLFWRQSMDEKGVQNIQSLMFLMLLNTSFQLLLAITTIFCQEMPIFFREYKSCLYGSDVFFLGKMIAELLVTVVLPAIFTSGLYWTVGLYEDYRAFLICVAVVTLCCNTTASFGYFLATATYSSSVATGIASAVIMPLSLLGGYFLNTGSIPFYLQWTKYISWFFYANEILNVNQWFHVTNISCHVEICPQNGQAILETLRFSSRNVYRDAIALLVITIGWRLLAYFFLLARARRWI